MAFLGIYSEFVQSHSAQLALSPADRPTGELHQASPHSISSHLTAKELREGKAQAVNNEQLPPVDHQHHHQTLSSTFEFLSGIDRNTCRVMPRRGWALGHCSSRISISWPCRHALEISLGFIANLIQSDLLVIIIDFRNLLPRLVPSHAASLPTQLLVMFIPFLAELITCIMQT